MNTDPHNGSAGAHTTGTYRYISQLLNKSNNVYLEKHDLSCSYLIRQTCCRRSWRNHLASKIDTNNLAESFQNAPKKRKRSNVSK